MKLFLDSKTERRGYIAEGYDCTIIMVLILLI